MKPTLLGPNWERREALKDRKGKIVTEVVMMQGDVIAKAVVAPIGTEVTMSNVHGDWLVRVIAEKKLEECVEACIVAAEKIGAVCR